MNKTKKWALCVLFTLIACSQVFGQKDKWFLPKVEKPQVKKSFILGCVKLPSKPQPKVIPKKKTYTRNSRHITSVSRHSLRSRGLDIGHTLNVVATAYYPGGGREGGPITATGHKVKKGVIAVDPRIIPLFTRVYVEGYGEAIALDTGGDIKGYHIDLAFNNRSEMNEWGKRKIRIRIIE